MPDSYLFGPFQLDLRGGEVRRGNERVALEPKVFALLSYLIAHRGRLVARQELIDALWPDAHVTDASLSQAIASLRTALGDHPRNPQYLETLPRRGYKFVAEVKEETEGAPAAAFSYHLIFGLQDFVLGPGEHVIGRAGDAAVRIKSGQVSRYHARIVISPSGVTIEDLGSMNGTVVSGERLVDRHELCDGDEIQLGTIVLTFYSPGGSRSSITTPVGS
ncbi:MAG TPA: winged helix-turn-helix domain-containing protein [Thermoanaerobaculia bacterium]|nr:winged helix-turn-helix domain-containing protein [Thermoanaerobaculia bacterium]